MRNILSLIKNFILIFVITGFSFEVGSFFATKLQLFLINETPKIYWVEGERYPDIALGRTEQEKWGAWHTANSTFRHVKSCFDVTMTFNEIGARDDSFTNLPQKSLFLVGDSFAEGYGVEKEETSEYIIEQNLEVPVLNFGASGNFGPLQELLIYEEFNHLPHQGLIVYVLPQNDFTDNDAAAWRAKDQTRYRPYFNEEGDPLVPYYVPTAIRRSNNDGSVEQIIRDYFWSSNALRTVLMLIRGDAQYAVNEQGKSFIPISYFYDASDTQQSHLVAAYEAVLETANNKNVLFVLIPAVNDIARWKGEADKNIYRESIWYSSLNSFQDRTEQKVAVIDLLVHLPVKTNELFFTCDGHWSPYGNAWAADVISTYIKDTNLFDLNN